MTLQRNIVASDAVALEKSEPSSVATIFNINDVLRIMRTRWHIIAGTTLIALAIGVISVYRITPLYTSTALVMLDSHQNRLVASSASLQRNDFDTSYDPALIENQIQILTSRALSARVIDKLHLDKDPKFNPALAPAKQQVAGPFDGVTAFIGKLNPRNWMPTAAAAKPSDEQRVANEREALIDKVLSGLTVRSRGLSTAIELNYVDPNPYLATTLANAVADAYVEDQLNAKYDASQKATSWLSDRIQTLADQVRNADVAVQQYKAENSLTETNGTTVADQQLSALNGQLIVARSDLAEQEAKYTQVVELQKAGRAEDISQVVASPTITNLRSQEADLLKREADFSTRYGPRHPRMLDLQSEKRNLLSKIDEEVQRVVTSVTGDLNVARARVKSLETSLQQATQHSTGDNRARIKLKELEANASSSHSMYDAYLGRFKETQGQEGIQMPDSRIISHAIAPSAPSSPNKVRALQMAGGIGLVLGFLLAILVERLDSGFRTSTQAERTLGLPVLATVPEIAWGGRSPSSASERVIDKPMSSFAEAIRGLQMGLVLSNVDKPPAVVLVTSAVPGEGKTTVAVSLARLVARTGKKVLIIDCDLRRPAVAKALGLDKLSHGLVQVLTGEMTFEECQIKDSRSSLHVLPVTLKTGNPPDILGSEAMERLIAKLRLIYDFVVLDSAPLLPVNDTRILARVVDAAVFVVRWEKTPREAARIAVRILAETHAPLTGVVMTRANTKRLHNYSYGNNSYTSYNKYYTN